MAGVRMQVKADRLRRKLLAAERKARGHASVWDDIGQNAVNSVRQNFDAGGRPQRWKPTKPATAIRKARRSRGARRRRIIAGNKILIDTGRLINSITYKVGRDHVSIGTNVAYASYHQQGTRRLPARPFMVLQHADRRAFRRIARDFIAGVFR